jgi:excisionase family DNA binding protein
MKQMIQLGVTGGSAEGGVVTTEYVELTAGTSTEAFEDLDAVLESDAFSDAELAALIGRHEVRGAIHTLVHELAAGNALYLLRRDAELTPNQAAEILGVSRTLVNKLIEAGELRAYPLPGSKHKKIPAAEVARLAAERKQMREGIDDIIDVLEDSGGEY